ncbi:MAG: GntR family transcriptional regulator [Thermoleophilia bacterium]
MLWHIDHSSPEPLRDQIVTCVRRGVSRGELAVGDRLPPAAELGEALSVDRNTVLAAYRRLRDEGVLEFRRGRGARVARSTRPRAAVVEAANRLIDAGRADGLSGDDLVRLIRELA